MPEKHISKISQNIVILTLVFVLVCGGLAFYQVSPVSAAPAPVTGIAPAGLADTNQPTFTWTIDSLGKATKYQLQIYNYSDKSSWYSWYNVDTLTRGSSTYSVAPGLTLMPGKYAWKVRYYDGKRNSSWSASLIFEVPANEPAPAPQEPTPTPTEPPASSPMQSPSDSTVVFSAGHESGDLSEWNAVGGFMSLGSGSYEVTTAQAHSGKYSTALTINTPTRNDQAAYLFFQRDLPGNAYYYSAWYYIPENVAPKDWWIVMEWEHTYDGGRKPTYVIDVRNYNGTWRLHLTYRPDLENSKLNYPQTVMEVPKGKWFHIEAYYKEAMDQAGQIIVWQDGVKVFDVSGNPTLLSTDPVVFFSLTNFSDYISPSPCTMYVDDAVISTSRIGTGGQPQPTLAPTNQPTATKVPTQQPTATKVPTLQPTATKVPTQQPTATKVPTLQPTATKVPTQQPTSNPYQSPTSVPTATKVPTQQPTVAPTQPPVSDPGIIFFAGHESGTISEWTTNSVGGFIAQNKGTYQVTTAQAHSGKYSVALTIDTVNNSGNQAAYLFYWKDLPNDAYYYSAWYYIPETVKPQEWWIIMQWKHTYDGNSDNSVPMYTVDVRNVNGVWRLHLTYRPDLSSKKNYTQSIMEVPKGKWFHIEGYYKEAQNSTGQIIIWQDGVKVFDVTGNPTALSPYRLYFSVNNYSDNILPGPCTIYVDDVIISNKQVGVNYKP